ncbi:MAG: Asp23/Gls24 family envelope stress response protein [Eubacteriales bacterium]|nr:Asp23/Gls24 family envelope stress response protein [Eubacteriales bacterium]
MAERESCAAQTGYENEKAGSVKIADDVIACIAALAATEIEGVYSMAGNVTNELIAKLGVKNLSKGVKLDLHDGEVSILLSLNMTYGYSIPEVSAKVQERVKNTVENMTGLHVVDVAINVAGVNTTENR